MLLAQLVLLVIRLNSGSPSILVQSATWTDMVNAVVVNFNKVIRICDVVYDSIRWFQ